MSEDILEYFVEKRRNVHVKGNIEWALKISINNGDFWTVETYTKNPETKTIEKMLSFAERVCEVYHKEMFKRLIPPFTLTRENE